MNNDSNDNQRDAAERDADEIAAAAWAAQLEQDEGELVTIGEAEWHDLRRRMAALNWSAGVQEHFIARNAGHGPETPYTAEEYRRVDDVLRQAEVRSARFDEFSRRRANTAPLPPPPHTPPSPWRYTDAIPDLVKVRFFAQRLIEWGADQSPETMTDRAADICAFQAFAAAALRHLEVPGTRPPRDFFGDVPF